MNNWRLYLLVGMLILSVIDLTATFFYIKQYKSWQSNKPYNLIEGNPLLVFLWNKLGFPIGMFVGSIIILTLIYLIGKETHWIVALLIFLVLIWSMYNHYHNFTLLYKLMEQYPLGHLPIETFGNVIGNN